MIKTYLKIIFLTAPFLFFLSGCHTIHGFGQDLQAGGEAINHAAPKVEK
ncbi:entericidin A/B family lipoprotein [Candidatus Coxiella mudrowiae]|nr:entericidin A/B family lipoprotein [Candidatus Coxiella mudrowiae]